MDTKEEDWVEHLFLAQTHDYLMIFTRKGHCYWLKVHQIPQAGRGARGKPIVNLLALSEEEKIAAVVPVREFAEDRFLMFATRNGLVKKTALSAYQHIRAAGVNAINILDDDELIDVQITRGDDEVILATREGLAIRFHESDVRCMGRVATGVRGINLDPGDRVIGMVVVKRESVDSATLLVATEYGRGKRTAVSEYRFQHRGGRGVINLKATEATGAVVAIKEVFDDDELMLITRNGVVNRQRIAEIRTIGRNTQGVRLMALDDGDVVMDVARLIPEDESPEEAAENEPELAPAGGATGAPQLAAPEVDFEAEEP